MSSIYILGVKNKPTLCTYCTLDTKLADVTAINVYLIQLSHLGFLPLQLTDAGFQHGDFWALCPEALNSPRALLQNLLSVCF